MINTKDKIEMSVPPDSSKVIPPDLVLDMIDPVWINAIRKTMVTIYFWLSIALGCAIAFIWIIPTWAFGLSSKAECREKIETLIASLSIVLMKPFWEVEVVDNREVKDDYSKSYVIVANHLSLIDTVFTSQLPYDKVYTWASKWKHTPVFGWLCQLAGHISIDKTCPISKKSALQLSQTHLEQGSSIFFYAEGRRGRNPKTMLPFKTGAFRVAQAANKKILPVTLLGTYEACTGFICDTGNIKIVIDEPIEAGEFTEIKEISDRVRAVMMENIKEHYHLE